jgi:Na+-translocating ferredoxin:NAD+ oxidoreductase subunit A
MTELLTIFLAAIIINNFVLSRFLGICPFLGVSRKMDTAIGMGLGVIFVMVLASAATWVISFYLLEPNNIGFMRTIAFILVIASLVQLVEMIIRKTSPALYTALGIYLPLITTNCAVLGVTFLNIIQNYDFIETVVHAAGGGMGFTVALALMAGTRQRLSLSNVPRPMQGVPIAFMVGALLALGFTGFRGML